MCGVGSTLLLVSGTILLGLCHSVFANRASHLAAHNALFETEFLNRIAKWICVEFTGFFSLKAALKIHIAEHHPYTNIIGGLPDLLLTAFNLPSSEEDRVPAGRPESCLENPVLYLE